MSYAIETRQLTRDFGSFRGKNLATLPVFVPPLLELLWRLAGGSVLVPVNLILSALLATLTAILYWQTLGPLGRLLQRREIKILNTVTAAQE